MLIGGGLRLSNLFVLQYFAREMIVWSKLRHVNVIELLVYLYDEARNPMFVSEWMENGTALDYVKNCPTANVFQLALGIARGLDYLHLSNVVHSDIKSVRSLGEGTPLRHSNVY